MLVHVLLQSMSDFVLMSEGLIDMRSGRLCAGLCLRRELAGLLRNLSIALLHSDDISADGDCAALRPRHAWAGPSKCWDIHSGVQ